MALWKQRAKGYSILLAGWSCTRVGDERNAGSRGIVGGAEGGAQNSSENPVLCEWTGEQRFQGTGLKCPV